MPPFTITIPTTPFMWPMFVMQVTIKSITSFKHRLNITRNNIICFFNLCGSCITSYTVFPPFLTIVMIRGVGKKYNLTYGLMRGKTENSAPSNGLHIIFRDQGFFTFYFQNSISHFYYVL